jgi:hypothetical protein
VAALVVQVGRPSKAERSRANAVANRIARRAPRKAG